MRLSKAERGSGLRNKLMFAMMRWKTGHRAPDVVRALRYREALFGLPFRQALQQAMRGPSGWSVGERELFAAFTARLSQCPF